MEAFNKLGWKVIFISPFSSEWAPIEMMLNTLNRRLQMHSKNILVNLYKEEGLSNIKEWLAMFTTKEIISY